jgi:DNA-binding Lrp family transcriptional regulator
VENASLDRFDRKLLEIMQRDCRKPHRELADAVGLSESAVRRRLDRMRAAGIIKAEMALLDRDLLGVTLIITVEFAVESPQAYAEFRARMRESAQVSQCYTIAGRKDFLVIAHAQSLPAYEAWAELEIMSDPAIARFDTAVVYSTVKFDTVVPLERLAWPATGR